MSVFEFTSKQTLHDLPIPRSMFYKSYKLDTDNVATAHDNLRQLVSRYPFAVIPTPFCSDLHY